jgi:hypothetical protein
VLFLVVCICIVVENDVGNSCPGLGQAHICGRVKPVKGSQSSPPDNLIFNDNTDTNNEEQHSNSGKDASYVVDLFMFSGLR